MNGITPLLAAGLHFVDWAILVLYASSTIFLGWWFGRRQKSAKEYFIGSGRMNPVLIGVSLFATLLSTISYLSFPGETFGKGPAYMANYLVYPVIFLIVGFVLIPVYMRQRVTSAYELLETRLGVSVRLLGAILFLMLRLVWMSLLIYMTAKALSVMVFEPGEGDKWVPVIVMITGLVAITYTMLGGLRAVVITDLMQTILLYGGALLVIGTVTWKMGGFGWFPTEWHSNWDQTQAFFPSDLSTRVTVIGDALPSVDLVCLHSRRRSSFRAAIYGDRERKGGTQSIGDSADCRMCGWDDARNGWLCVARLLRS